VKKPRFPRTPNLIGSKLALFSGSPGRRKLPYRHATFSNQCGIVATGPPPSPSVPFGNESSKLSEAFELNQHMLPTILLNDKPCF